MVDYQYVPLTRTLANRPFSCGDTEMDDWFKKYAWQAQTANSAAVWIQQEEGTDTMTGFYTLSSYAVNARTLPPELRKGLSQTGDIGCSLLGRLGVQESHQGQGAFRDMLPDALLRVLGVKRDVSFAGVVVDARTDALVDTYAKRGFVLVDPAKRRMYMPMKTIEQIAQSRVASAGASSL